MMKLIFMKANSPTAVEELLKQSAPNHRSRIAVHILSHTASRYTSGPAHFLADGNMYMYLFLLIIRLQLYPVVQHPQEASMGVCQYHKGQYRPTNA
jgi:hypothetical protein